MKELRPYQINAVKMLRENISAGFRRQILHLRTGSGKTVVASHMMNSAVLKGRRCLFVVHRRNLVDNCVKRLREDSLPCDVIMSGRKRTAFDVPIAVASRDTLTRRCAVNGEPLPPADLVIVDEGHLATAAGYVELLKQYPNATVIYLTATPSGPKGTGLGSIASKMVSAATSAQLIQDGFIVPTRVLAPFRIDLSGIHVVKGDYNVDELSERIDRPTLIGDIVETWKAHASDRPTVAFACRREHAQHICDLFNAAGVSAAYLDGESPDKEREAVEIRMRRGEIKVIANVDIISIGTDWPFLKCCIDAAPTKSLVKLLQKAGRISRPDGDWKHAIYLDHADNCLRLKLHPDDDLNWPLSESQKPSLLNNNPQQQEMKWCVECYALYRGSRCPNCGHAKSKQFEVEAGVLVEVKPGQEYAASNEDKERAWNTSLAIAANKGWTLGRAAGVYKSKMGEFPRDFARLPGNSKWPPSHAAFGTFNKETWTLRVCDIWPGFVRGKAGAAT